MVTAFPLFPGVPGGPELLIVLFVMLLLFGVSTLLVGGAAVLGLRYVRGGDTREERIDELEREVRELRARLGEGRTVSDDPAGGDERAGAETDAYGDPDGDRER